MKKLLAVLLSLLLIVTACNVMVFADDIPVFDLDSLNEALQNAENGDTVILGNNVDLNPVTGLQGEGTEENPYLIGTLDELKWFRDSVNTYTSDGSNQYKGKYIKLTADIDLNGDDWTPIGDNTTNDHEAFLGIFDGDGHTIKNLYVNSDGDYLGFFARTGNFVDGQSATIKNVTFENVDVSSNTTTSHSGSYVGGVVANSGGNTVIENVHVKGYVYVVGYGYVGGIVGHGYPKINNSSVKAEDGSYVLSYFWCAGGMVGYGGEGGTKITNCEVSGLYIWTAYGAGAAVCGLAQTGAVGENLTVSDVEIESDSDYCMGYVFGNGEEGTLTNVTISNVTATAKGNPITSTDGIEFTKPAASIGEADYNSLSEAFAAAKDGDTITLLSDLVIDTETYTIADGKSVTLDMNGKKLTVTDNKDAKTNYELFYNYGELTVTGNGTIELTSTSNDTAWAKSSSIFHNRGGVLTIENGTYVHTGGTCMAYVIDNSANSFGDATTTVKAGTLTSSYIAIRNRMDTYGANGGGNGIAKLVVEGGTLSGKYAVWGQVSSTGSKGEIVIKGGNFTANAGKNPLIVDTDATGDVKVAVSGGAFSAPVSKEFCADGFVPVDNGDGTYGVNVTLPSATVTDIELKDLDPRVQLTFAKKFIADEADANVLATYKDWYADFVLTVNKDVTFNANGGADGYLAGQYDEWSENWVSVPFENVTLKANEPLKIMEYAAKLMNKQGLKLTVNDVYEFVKEFDCGVFFDKEFMAANPDLEVTLELRIFHPENEEITFVIHEKEPFTLGVATVNGYSYETIEEAVIAANSVEKAEIVLLEDITVDGYATIVKGADVTLDLNGHTVIGTDTTEKNFGLIQNNGTLTVKDSVGGGKISLTATINSGWNRYSAVISNNPGGTLVIESGILEHLGGTDMAYGIDSLTNGGIGDVSVTINGGTVSSTYRAVRQFLNSDSKQNVLTVNGGTLKGDNKSIFFQDPSKKANNGTLTIGENAELYGDVYLFVTEGSTEWPVEVSIAEAALQGESTVTSKNVPAGLAVENTNGTFGVVAKEAVATVDGVEYYDLQAAIDAAANGGTVVLVADVALEAPITVAKDADVTINLNGYDITYVATSTGHNCMITNYGKLTFNGEGNVTYTDHGPAANPNSSYALNLIENRDATLIINGGTFTVETPDAGLFNVTALVIDNYASSADSYVEINGGKFVSEYFRTIRLFATSETYDNKVVINDGVFVGQVWLQSTNAKQNRATLEINGGEFGPTANDGSSVYITTVTSTAIDVAITGGTFNGKIGVDNTANVSGFVTGGTFSANAKAATNEAVLAENFEFVENSDGTFGVVEEEEETQLNTRLYYVKGFKPAGGTETRYGFLMTIGIDSLDYKSDGCGFYLTVGGVTKKFIIENGVVWSDLTVELPGKTDYITPEQFGAGNKYIMNHTVYFTENDLAALGNMQVSVQGFVTTFDGVEIRTAVFNCGTLVQ